MPFPPETKRSIEDYVSRDLANDDWYRDYFRFVTDLKLAGRLCEEFKAARSIYKIFEGLGAIDWQQRAQVRIQVLQYASIYEAVIHHLLFDRLKSRKEVLGLVEINRFVKVSIPGYKLSVLEKALSHDGKKIVPMYEKATAVDHTKVRFDEKIKCAAKLGLIDANLCKDLTEIYEARNAIHIHAELRKGLKYEIELARTAYRRAEPFRKQIVEGMLKLGLLNAPL